jgi:nucleotide-binding universal stress UspA family protein
MTESTPTPRRIVAGVDTSENAARAAMWAARQAVDLGLPLQLIHALDLGAAVGYYSEASDVRATLRESGAKLLTDVTRRVQEQFPALRVDTELVEPSAPEALVAASASDKLIVTGTRGHGGFAGLLIGSVSLKLAVHAHGPAVVVRGEQAGEPLDEIVLGLEPGEAQPPIRYAFATAAALGATVHVVRAWLPHPAYAGRYVFEDAELAEREQRVEAEALIKDAQERYPDVRVTLDVVRGNAVPMLIEAARGCRLLVVGSHRRRAPLSVGAGYVLQGLLSHAPTPIAIVPITE